MLKLISRLAFGSLLFGIVMHPTAQAEDDVLHLPCGDRENIVASLKSDFGEAAVGSGVTETGRVLELFTSQNGDWTILLNVPTGPACVLVSGTAWKTQPKQTKTK